MSYLIDTNVISELAKQRRNKAVERWFGQIDACELYLSVLSVGEICHGIERASDDSKRRELVDWMDSVLLEWFSGRLLPVDEQVMRTWANICANTRTLPVMDSLVAAVARTHDLTLVTRNVRDFEDIVGLTVLNPWNSTHE